MRLRKNVNVEFTLLSLHQVYKYNKLLGRLIDMMRNKYLDTTHLKLLVVDEADNMLDRGFVDNIKEIL